MGGMDSIAIAAVGMISPVGMDAKTSCASAMAGLARPCTIEMGMFSEDEAEPVPFTTYPIEGITGGFQGLGRLLRIAVPSLKEAYAMAGLDEREKGGVGFFLALPSSYYSENLESDGQKPSASELKQWQRESRESDSQTNNYFHSRLFSLAGIEGRGGKISTNFKGCAGGFEAINQAMIALQEGSIRYGVVGGVDSFLDENSLETLLQLGVLKSGANPAGLIPSEAGCFLVMERTEDALTRGARILGRINRAVTAEDPNHLFSGVPANGRVLAACIEQSVAGKSGAADQGRLVIGNLNGTEYRSRDWGTAFSLLKPDSRKGMALEEWQVAECFGEIGAATVPTALCMGMHAFSRGFIENGNILVAASCDDGSRGALWMNHPSG